MGRFICALLATLLLAGVVVLAADGGKPVAAAAGAKPTPRSAGKAPKAAPAPAKTDDELAADACYEKIVRSFMKGKWRDLAGALKKEYPKHLRRMTSEQRRDVTYVRKTAARHRPTWWKYTKSSSNKSFRARIWNRPLTVNYMPSGMLGGMAPVAIIRGRLQVIVTWRPILVDDPDPARGRLAKAHAMTKGHIAEAIVWHEMGHNYISSFLPLKHVIALYNDHSMLYAHLQEFYADMTSLYHCSPTARLASLTLRTNSLEHYRRSEEHTRASLGIGSLLLTQFLSAPEKWPSIHFPPKVPEKDIERKTVIYVYDHIDPKWTLAEDRELSTFVSKYIRANGAKILRKRGRIDLPNKLTFMLMATDDREDEPKRNAWVKKQLGKLIKDGRADKLPKKPTTKPSRRYLEPRIVLPWDD